MTPLDEARALLAADGIHPFFERNSRVPRCHETCPQYDGKRCLILGCRPDGICEPGTERLLALTSPPTAGTEGAASPDPAADVAAQVRTGGDFMQAVEAFRASLTDDERRDLEGWAKNPRGFAFAEATVHEVEARTVEAIAAWLFGIASNNPGSPFANIYRRLGFDLRGGFWRPNPESKEG